MYLKEVERRIAGTAGHESGQTMRVGGGGWKREKCQRGAHYALREILPKF